MTVRPADFPMIELPLRLSEYWLVKRALMAYRRSVQEQYTNVTDIDPAHYVQYLKEEENHISHALLRMNQFESGEYFQSARRTLKEKEGST